MDLQFIFSEIREKFDLYYSIVGENINDLYQLIYTLPLLTILQNNGAAIGVAIYILWYIKAYLSRTELVSKKGSYMNHLVEKFPSFHSGYRPTIWCFPAFLNTAIFSVIQRCIKHDYEREILKTPDGGQIAIDWANLNAKNNLIMLVLPGLTGCSKDNYVSHFVDKAIKSDCKAIVMNYRGIEVDLLTPKTYSATNLEDLHLVIEHIKEKFPNHDIFAIGVSLGGLKLGGYLAKQYDNCSISYAMIISAPFNVFNSAKELEKSTNLFFNKFLAKNISNYCVKYKHLFENDFDFKKISRCQSLREIDIHFTSKLFGYETCDDYYREACLDAKIQDIRTPTLFLNAADDMFSPADSFPIDKFNSNPNVALVMTKYGGHISFVEGLFPTGCNFACRLLKDYLNNILIELKNKNSNQILTQSSSSSLSNQQKAKFSLE